MKSAATRLLFSEIGDAFAGVVVALRILWPRTSRYLAAKPPPGRGASG